MQRPRLDDQCSASTLASNSTPGAAVCNPQPSAGGRAVAFAFLVQGLAILAYWAAYFSSSPAFNAMWYKKFEDSFVVADLVLACHGFAYVCLLHGPERLRCPRLALVCGLLAAGETMYLAGLDITFDVENDMYGYIVHGNSAQATNMILELVINIWCVTFGGLVLPVYIYRHLDMYVHPPEKAAAVADKDTPRTSLLGGIGSSLYSV